MINSWDTEERVYISSFLLAFLDYYCRSDERMERETLKKMWSEKKIYSILGIYYNL